MSHFPDFTNMSARFDSLIHDEKRTDVRIPISKKHHIFMSITRIGLFKTGGIHVQVLSVSKSGALFNTTHHALLKSVGKELTIELSLNGKHFECEAHIVQQDAINNLYGIKFNQSLEAIDNYLAEFNIHPRYGENAPQTSSVWLDFGMA